MKKHILILFFLGIALVSFSQSKKEKQVAIAIQQLTKAMEDGEGVMLDKLTDESLSYGHSGGHIDLKKEFVEKIASGTSDFVKINLSNQQVAMHKNTAIVRHHLDATTNDGGKPGAVSLDVLLVWQKNHGQWKLLARQAVKSTK